MSSDLYTIDDSLPFILNILLANFFNLLGIAIVLSYVQVSPQNFVSYLWVYLLDFISLKSKLFPCYIILNWEGPFRDYVASLLVYLSKNTGKHFIKCLFWFEFVPYILFLHFEMICIWVLTIRMLPLWTLWSILHVKWNEGKLTFIHIKTSIAKKFKNFSKLSLEQFQIYI